MSVLQPCISVVLQSTGSNLVGRSASAAPGAWHALGKSSPEVTSQWLLNPVGPAGGVLFLNSSALHIRL